MPECAHSSHDPTACKDWQLEAKPIWNPVLPAPDDGGSPGSASVHPGGRMTLRESGSTHTSCAARSELQVTRVSQPGKQAQQPLQPVHHDQHLPKQGHAMEEKSLPEDINLCATHPSRPPVSLRIAAVQPISFFLMQHGIPGQQLHPAHRLPLHESLPAQAPLVSQHHRPRPVPAAQIPQLFSASQQPGLPLQPMVGLPHEPHGQPTPLTSDIFDRVRRTEIP